MPLSIAACRTVRPLGTVTGRPSMVRVTVSISSQFYTLGIRYPVFGLRSSVFGAPRIPDSGYRLPDLCERAVVVVDRDPAHLVFELDLVFREWTRGDQDDILRESRGVGDADGHREVHRVFALFQAEGRHRAFDPVVDLHGGERRVEHPPFEKAG